jgi:hypothetical protein
MRALFEWKLNARAPDELKNIILNTSWFDEIRYIRIKYAIHHNHSIGGILNNNAVQLVSHLRDDDKKTLERTYHINDIQKISDDVLQFFDTLADCLCDNFNMLPFRIRKNV